MKLFHYIFSLPFLQTLMNVVNSVKITAVKMPNALTPLEVMSVHVCKDILEMERYAKVMY